VAGSIARDRLALAGLGLCAATLTIALLSAVPAATVHADSAAKSRGAQLFADSGCVHCHGAAGISGAEGPSLAHVRKRRKPPEIFTQIHDGGKAMPAFGDQLSAAQIDDLVEYLRSKRKAPKP
jgi:mono/diheme cytochrome c family protein